MKTFILISDNHPISLLAKGVSPFLPLNISPEVELQIEKLMALTSGPALTKPYKAKDDNQITGHHPLMYHRLSSYLKR